MSSTIPYFFNPWPLARINKSKILKLFVWPLMMILFETHSLKYCVSRNVYSLFSYSIDSLSIGLWQRGTQSLKGNMDPNMVALWNRDIWGRRKARCQVGSTWKLVRTQWDRECFPGKARLENKSLERGDSSQKMKELRWLYGFGGKFTSLECGIGRLWRTSGGEINAGLM